MTFRKRTKICTIGPKHKKHTIGQSHSESGVGAIGLSITCMCVCVWIAYNPAPRNDFWFFPVSLFLLRDFFLLVRKKSRFVYIFCCAKRNNPLVFWSYYMLHIFLGNSPAIFGNNIHKACQAFSDPRMAAVMQEQQPCGRCRYCLSLMCTWMNFECFTVKSFTLQAGIHISHLGKRKRHMLIPWRVMTLMSTIFLVSDLLFSCHFFLVFQSSCVGVLVWHCFRLPEGAA